MTECSHPTLVAQNCGLYLVCAECGALWGAVQEESIHAGTTLVILDRRRAVAGLAERTWCSEVVH